MFIALSQKAKATYSCAPRFFSLNHPFEICMLWPLVQESIACSRYVLLPWTESIYCSLWRQCWNINGNVLCVSALDLCCYLKPQPLSRHIHTASPCCIIASIYKLCESCTHYSNGLVIFTSVLLREIVGNIRNVRCLFSLWKHRQRPRRCETLLFTLTCLLEVFEHLWRWWLPALPFVLANIICMVITLA